jgi:hypothetical protein
MPESSRLMTYTRSGTGVPEEPYEKPVVVPAAGEKDVALHAWADARFATDIMAEHALFFALLMPPEVAAAEREEALRFHGTFSGLNLRIDESPPGSDELDLFFARVSEPMRMFIDYKARLGQAQAAGELRSLVWPLFFDHTRHEAERWTRRLEGLRRGESEFDRGEVVEFWANIMDEHARFIAHLLDPDEFELVDKAMKTAAVFADLRKGGVGGAISALAHEPGTVVDSLRQNPETDAIYSAAQTILDFKTEAARDIEAGRIKSIIDPRLADHVRREALKFADELNRAV